MQKINFISGVSKASNNTITPEKIILVIILIFSGIILRILFSLPSYFELNSKISQALAKQNEIQAALLNFHQTIGELPPENIEEGIQNLKSEYEKIKKDFGVVLIMPENERFSLEDYWRALSQTITNGVWLTHIQITNLQNDFVMQGEANNSIVLHDYLEQLFNNKLFSKKGFEIIKIDHSPENKDILFTLSTLQGGQS